MNIFIKSSTLSLLLWGMLQDVPSQYAYRVIAEKTYTTFKVTNQLNKENGTIVIDEEKMQIEKKAALYEEKYLLKIISIVDRHADGRRLYLCEWEKAIDKKIMVFVKLEPTEFYMDWIVASDYYDETGNFWRMYFILK